MLHPSMVSVQVCLLLKLKSEEKMKMGKYALIFSHGTFQNAAREHG